MKLSHPTIHNVETRQTKSSFCLAFQHFFPQFPLYKKKFPYELSKFQVKTFYSIAILTAINTEYINLPQAKKKSTNKIKIVKHFQFISQHVLFLLLSCNIFSPVFHHKSITKRFKISLMLMPLIFSFAVITKGENRMRKIFLNKIFFFRFFCYIIAVLFICISSFSNIFLCMNRKKNSFFRYAGNR